MNLYEGSVCGGEGQVDDANAVSDHGPVGLIAAWVNEWQVETSEENRNWIHLLETVPQDNPRGNWEKRKEKLSSQREEQRGQQQRCHQRLDHRPGLLDDTEQEDAEDGQEEVLAIVVGPLVVSERS